MTYLFCNNFNNVFSIFGQFKFLETKIILKKSKSIKKNEVPSYEDCDRIFQGFVLCFVGLIMFLIGIIMMSIVVCVRRRNMLFIDHVDNMQFKRIYFGVKRMYISVIIKETTETLELHQNGFWGTGFYFYQSEECSIEQTMILAEEQNISYKSIFVVTCDVDFGHILEVPREHSSNFRFPATLKEYDCTSVMGYNSQNVVQYVMYSISKIDMKKIEEYLPSNGSKKLIKSFD